MALLVLKKQMVFQSGVLLIRDTKNRKRIEYLWRSNRMHFLKGLKIHALGKAYRQKLPTYGKTDIELPFPTYLIDLHLDMA